MCLISYSDVFPYFLEGFLPCFLQAIANLSVNTEVAKRVALEGGICILAALARSPNRWVAEEAAGGLWNLSVGEEHKVTVAECILSCFFSGVGILRCEDFDCWALWQSVPGDYSVGRGRNKSSRWELFRLGIAEYIW